MKPNKYNLLWVPILLGITAFIFVTGGKIIWPTNINWLYMNGDIANDLISWQFFRDTPIFQNPLGSNYPYSMGVGGSIVYAEQLFLFAFPFKLFSKILSTPFQYEGIWILLCFIFQGLFAWKLIEKITNVFLLKFLGSVFFILAPPFLWRLHGSPSFFGQWLILAGILLYLSDDFRKYFWPILLSIAALVHPYFLFMLLAIWLADLLQKKLTNVITFQTIISYITLTSLLLLIIIWQEGYLMIHSGYEEAGFGFFRMNLLAFIDSTDAFCKSWSLILPDLSHTGGDYEGFSYLGLGIIILIIIGLSKLIIQQPIRNIVLKFKKLNSLMVVSFLLMLFALSNHIAFGRYELFHYKVPGMVNMFRASGRMALPMFYLIYLGAINLTAKCYKKKTAILLIFMALVIQISDSRKVYTHFRNILNHAPLYISGLNSPIWEEAAKKYKKIIYVLPEVYVRDSLALINYAAFNKLMINIGFFARHDLDKFFENKNKILNDLLQGKLDKNSFYVIKNESLRRMITNTKMNLPYKVVDIDGYALLLPNWKQNSTKMERLNWSGSYNKYELNTSVSFLASNKDIKNTLTLIDGWGGLEANGTWTDGNRSILFLQLNQKPNSNLVLTLDSLPFINYKHPKLVVDINVNRCHVGHLNYKLNDYSRINKIEIPLECLDKDNLLKMTFLFKNSISPLKLNLSSDSRKLGLFILSMILSEKRV